MRQRRPISAILVAVALVVAMSGCAMFRGASTSTQLNTIGKVQVTSTICAADVAADNSGYSPGDATCQASGTTGNFGNDAVNGNYQISLAYKIPTGSSGPASFTSTNTTTSASNTPCGSGVTFNQSSGLASAIQALSPAGSGKKWVAYYTTAGNYTTAGCQYLTVSPQFTLNQGFGVAPFTGPFTYRPIVGWRQVNEGQAGNTSARAASCGSSSITSSYRDGADTNPADGTPDEQGICADDPTAATISGTDLSQNTRDLGVIPNGNGSAQAGASGSVSFNLSYKGAALPSGTFNLSASTNISGATATPSQATLTPGADSDNTVTVNVTVPATTTPGDYTVNLTATLSTDGTQTRGGSIGDTLTVGENLGFGTVPTLPTLGSFQLNGQAQTTSAKMNNFGVIDSPGSSDVGWNVTVIGDSATGKSAVFKQYCPAPSAPCGSDPAGYVTGGRVLVANSLTLNTTGASWTGGTGSAPTFNCSSSCFVDAASAQKIASAANAAGTGLWSTSGFGNSSVSLSTPTTLRVLPSNEQYHADLVWTLNSGP